MKMNLAVILVSLALVLGFWGTVIFVVLHFVSRAW